MVQVAGILSLSAGLLLLLHGIALPGVSEAKTPRTHTGLQKGLRSTGHQRPSYQKPAAQTNPGSVLFCHDDMCSARTCMKRFSQCACSVDALGLHQCGAS